MKKITLILFALFTCWQINAQVSSYAFSQSSGTYSEITGGTVLGDADNDDDSFNANPIGFSFVFNGITYTQFSVNSNGFIALGATVSSSYNAISGGTSNNVIVALNGDLNGSATGELSYQLSGTAPNQVLTIQWKNYRHYAAAGDVNNFQIKLYETTNVVGVVYGTFTQNATSRTREVGLRGASNADFNNRSTTADWAATSAGATNAASCTLTAAVVPTSGLTFTWTPPSCAAPAGFVASALTASTATIAWNAAVPVPSTGYEYYYSDVNTAPSGAGTATTNLTENLTGLSVNTPYYVWLRSDCGGTFSAWSGPFTFRTACETFTVPFTEGFNSTSTSEGCWTILDGNADADTWNTNYVTNPFEGDQSAMINTDFNNGANNDWLISPTITLTGNQRLKFHYRVQSAGEPNDFELLLSTTGNTPASFTNTLIANTSYSNITYVEKVVDLSAYSGNVNIAWHVPAGGLDGWRLYIDNVIVEDIPSCVEPNTIIASNITSTTVDLSWTDGSGGLQYDYQYAIQSPGTGIPTGAGAPIDDITVIDEGFDIDGNPLTPNTLYEVYVRADCGGGDFSPWVGPITFRTLCQAINTFPFVETFDVASTTESCWSVINGNADLDLWNMNGTTIPRTGQAAELYTDFNSVNNDYLVTPQLNLGSVSKRLKFWVRHYSNLEPDNLNVKLSTTDGNIASFTNTLLTLSTTQITTTYTEYVVDLSSYTGLVYIAFARESDPANGWYISIDDVSVEDIPSCTEPTVFTIDSVGTDSATVSWTAGATETEWEYVIQAQGVGVPAGAGISTASNPLTISGLTPNTPYEIYLRAVCSLTEQSIWVGPFDFTTNTEVVCGTPVNTTHCYTNNDTTTWTFTSNDGSPLRVTFNAGELESCCDDIYIYDGTDNSGNLLYSGNNGGDLTGLTFGSTSDSIYIEIDSDGSLSCGDGGTTTQWDFTVVCATCVNPTATFTIEPDCANGQFSIDVNVTNIGSATSLAISDGTTNLTGISAIGVQTFGPYADGASVTIDVTNEQDNSCTISSGALTNVCPPANDDCANAFVVTMPYTFTQDASTAINNAGFISQCGFGMNDGVWYTVVGDGGDITIDVIGVTGWDPEIGVYTGSCGAFTCVGSADVGGIGDSEQYKIIGSSVGVTYYINIGHYSGSTNSPEGPFTIDVSTTLSTNTFNSNEFVAYPNPVKDVLTLEYTSDISSVRVLNMLGQEVLTRTVNAASAQVDMSQLSAGAYIVNVTIDDTVKTIKVVKQ